MGVDGGLGGRLSHPLSRGLATGPSTHPKTRLSLPVPPPLAVRTEQGRAREALQLLFWGGVGTYLQSVDCAWGNQPAVQLPERPQREEEEEVRASACIQTGCRARGFARPLPPGQACTSSGRLPEDPASTAPALPPLSRTQTAPAPPAEFTQHREVHKTLRTQVNLFRLLGPPWFPQGAEPAAGSLHLPPSPTFPWRVAPGRRQPLW